jgi:hypothetical protein
MSNSLASLVHALFSDEYFLMGFKPPKKYLTIRIKDCAQIYALHF